MDIGVGERVECRNEWSRAIRKKKNHKLIENIFVFVQVADRQLYLWVGVCVCACVSRRARPGTHTKRKTFHDERKIEKKTSRIE